MPEQKEYGCCHIEVGLQQARRLAQREKTAGHARAMLNHSLRPTPDEPDAGVGLIERPTPAPEIGSSASGGPVHRGALSPDNQRRMRDAAKRAAQEATARLQASGPVRLEEIRQEQERDRKKLADQFRRRVKKDAKAAMERLVASRRDRLAEIQREQREITRNRFRATRKGGAGAMAQARPPP